MDGRVVVLDPLLLLHLRCFDALLLRLRLRFEIVFSDTGCMIDDPGKVDTAALCIANDIGVVLRSLAERSRKQISMVLVSLVVAQLVIGIGKRLSSVIVFVGALVINNAHHSFTLNFAFNIFLFKH